MTEADSPGPAPDRVFPIGRLLLYGRHAGPSTFQSTRWLFLRLVGVVYLIAFLSYWVQLDGLIGAQGVLPVREFLDRVWNDIGAAGYWRLPTLAWIDASDPFLHVLCGAGVALSALLVVGVAPVPALLALWALYLSLSVAGQTFYSFQWDILLLEAGFCATFFAPSRLLPRLPRSEPAPPAVGRWLLWLLLFKLMFLSGATKLISLDETWWNLTALDYHYYTQPLPTWTAWYVHHAPAWFGTVSILFMYFAELVVPFCVFLPRGPRTAGALVLLTLQVLIAATGNYTFFNLLSGMLCLVLLDDATLGTLLPARLREAALGDPRALAARAVEHAHRSLGYWIGRTAVVPVAIALMVTSGVAFVDELVRTRRPGSFDGLAGTVLDAGDRLVLSWGRPVLRWTDPFRTVNGYGLFRSMTTERREIQIEGSEDGRTWLEYGFRWKPDDVVERPRFVAPHQPRLDWQMWFAALAPDRHGHWLRGLLGRVLQGSPDVLELLEPSPFPDGPPRYVRLVYYRYEFTTPDERRETGAWWKRRQLGYLTKPLTRDDL